MYILNPDPATEQRAEYDTQRKNYINAIKEINGEERTSRKLPPKL